MKDTTLTLTTQVSICLPLTPNFIRTSKTNETIDIKDFTDEQLREIGHRWVISLLERARYRRRKNGFN